MVQQRVVIYSRVSTDAQERDGTSLETQERECMAYAQAHRWDVIECISDSASGYTLERPGMERVRSLLQQGSVDIVLSYEVDRLSRNQNITGVLLDETERAGARLDFVTEDFEDTAVGKFILAARAFVAEVEREKIVERTMRGKGERARSGKLPQGTGKGCYGYIYHSESGQREINPRQAEIVTRVFNEFLRKTPLVRITNQLNDEHVPAFSGGIWYPATLHRMLRNETYTGRTIYRRTLVTDKWQPGGRKKKRHVSIRPQSEWIEIDNASPQIVSAEQFQAVQSILDDPERRRLGHQRKYDYALSGRIKCIQCGRAMVGQTQQKRWPYYRCRRAYAGPKHDRCPSRYVRAENLEATVKAEMAKVLANPEIIIAESELFGTSNGNEDNRDALNRQMGNLDKQRLRLLKLYQLDEIDDGYFERELKTVKNKMTDVGERLDRALTTFDVPTEEQLLDAVARVRSWIEEAEGDDLALLLEALQVQVRAEKGRGELSGIIPEYSQPNSDAYVRSMVIKLAIPSL